MKELRLGAMYRRLAEDEELPERRRPLWVWSAAALVGAFALVGCWGFDDDFDDDDFDDGDTDFTATATATGTGANTATDTATGGPTDPFTEDEGTGFTNDFDGDPTGDGMTFDGTSGG